ncbi:MAG: hypothetical protein AAGG01_05065 [Planctomycetota bacterium]
MRFHLLAIGLGLTSCAAPPSSSPMGVDPTSEGPVQVLARLEDRPVTDGPARAVIELQLAPGVSAQSSGIPGCIVQLDPPPGVELLGERVLEFEALRDNEFLMEPWERLMDKNRLTVPLRLAADLAPDATLGINVIGYVASSPGKDDAFFRQRLELPLLADSTAFRGDPTQTSWGPFGAEIDTPGPLTIGESIPAFRLPRLGADRPWSSAEVIGTQPALIVTYRGHW